jgi:hypothetical protein
MFFFFADSHFVSVHEASCPPAQVTPTGQETPQLKASLPSKQVISIYL